MIALILSFRLIYSNLFLIIFSRTNHNFPPKQKNNVKNLFSHFYITFFFYSKFFTTLKTQFYLTISIFLRNRLNFSLIWDNFLLKLSIYIIKENFNSFYLSYHVYYPWWGNSPTFLIFRHLIYILSFPLIEQRIALFLH